MSDGELSRKKLLSQTINQVMERVERVRPGEAYFVLTFCREAVRVHYDLTREEMEEAERAARAGVTEITSRGDRRRRRS